MTEWSSANLWRVIDRPEYTFEVEELRSGDNQMIFIHLDVRHWTKSVLKQLLAEFKAFRQVVDVPIYCTSPIADEKWQSFVSLFGFKPLVDNGEHRIFISIKDNNNGVVRKDEARDPADEQPVGQAVPVSGTGLQRSLASV